MSQQSLAVQSATQAPVVPNVVRSEALADMWRELSAHFPEIPALSSSEQIPKDICVSLSFPSRGSRGRAESRRPAEFLRQNEWKGSKREQTLLSIHPERFNSPDSVAKSMLYAAGELVLGKRGVSSIGIERKNDDLHYTNTLAGERAKRIIKLVIARIPDIPLTHAVLPEPIHKPQATRLRLWECPTCHIKVRIASDTIGLQLIHNSPGDKKRDIPLHTSALQLIKRTKKEEVEPIRGRRGRPRKTMIPDYVEEERKRRVA